MAIKAQSLKGAEPSQKKLLMLWLVPLVAMMAIGTVWLRLMIVDTTYAIHQLEETNRALRQEKVKAELRLATQRSPRRLEQLAKTKYQLAPPRTDQVIFLK
jgi:cell division protein FtsL